MRTKKQIAASRENGRRSHGATTPEGKARIVAANIKSGVFAESQVVAWEDKDALQALKDEYYALHPPASPEARCLLDQIILCEWHLRRFTWVEDALWDSSFFGSPENTQHPCADALRASDHTLTRLQHRINSTRRAFHNALTRLEELEARDQDVVVISAASDSAATPSLESRLPVLGSLRKIDSPSTSVTPISRLLNASPRDPV